MDFKPFKRAPKPTDTTPTTEVSQDIAKPSTDTKPSLLAGSSPSKPKRSLFGKITLKKLLIIVPLVLLLIAAGIATYLSLKNRKPPADTSKTTKTVYTPPKPTTEPSRLTGVEVSPEMNKRPVTGIMIENSPDARPQSGLLDAGVVYEAIAEGGITRFLTLFQEAQPQYIGPVRSVRPYYLDFLVPYDAAVAHAGGSGEALNQIKTQGIKDLDQFFNSGSYQRISSRYAPHNLYTSFAKLDALNKKKGFTSSTFTGLSRKKEEPSKTPTAIKIDFSISSYLYSPHYEYDAATNSYKRSEGGKPHVDDKSAKQLSPKVVVALVVPYRLNRDGIHSEYTTTGPGKAFVFQDGIVTEVIWTKGGRKDQLKLVDAAGNTIKLNPGQTWVSLVAGANLIKYTGRPAPAS